MQRRYIVKSWFVGLLAALVVGGCATTNSVESRKKEHYSAYQSLSPEMRTAVDHGRVTAGMPMDAVYIAWGKPSEESRYGGPGGESVAWIYKDSFAHTTTFMGGRHVYYGYTTIPYIRAQVEFVNGVVRNWQTFSTPAY